jgi:hypothetical protein
VHSHDDLLPNEQLQHGQVKLATTLADAGVEHIEQVSVLLHTLFDADDCGLTCRSREL